MISTDAYISIMIGSILLELIALIIGLIPKKKEISPKTFSIIIFVAIILYAIVAVITTIIYRNNDLLKFFDAFKETADYIDSIILTKWYNFFIPSYCVKTTGTFMDSTSLLFLYIILKLIIFVGCIVLGGFILGDALEFWEGFWGVFFILLSVLFPMFLFYYIDSIYCFYDYSVPKTWLFIIAGFAIIIAIIIACFVISEKDDLTPEERKQKDNEKESDNKSSAKLYFE